MTWGWPQKTSQDWQQPSWKGKGSGKGSGGGSFGAAGLVAQLNAERKEKEELLAEKRDNALSATVQQKVKDAFSEFLPGSTKKKKDDEDKEKTPKWSLVKGLLRQLGKKDSDEHPSSSSKKERKRGRSASRGKKKKSKKKKKKRNRGSRFLWTDSQASSSTSSSSSSSSSSKSKNRKKEKKYIRAEKRREDKRRDIRDRDRERVRDRARDDEEAPKSKLRKIPSDSPGGDAGEGEEVELHIRNQIEKSLGLTHSSGAEGQDDWIKSTAKATDAKKLNLVLAKCAKANPDSECNLSQTTSPSKAGKISQIVKFLQEPSSK